MFTECFDPERWEELLISHSGSFLQSWSWGEFQKACGYGVRRFTDGAGFCQIITKPVGLGMDLWYGARLPAEFSDEGLDGLRASARKVKALLFRFEPALAPPFGRRVSSASPTVTQITDLTKSDEVLLAEMHQKTRYNIRLAEKKGVIVELSDQVGAWCALMSETSKRDGFQAHPDAYYRTLLTTLPSARLYLARDGSNGQPLAASIVIFQGQTATYLFGASSSEKREYMAPYALHFEVMRQARLAGCSNYDWWGVNPANREHFDYRASWEGITRFKQSFGGERKEFAGTFEIGLRPFWYALHSCRRFWRKLGA